MPTLTDNDAFAHPGYDDAVAKAVALAHANAGRCFSVYYDGLMVYVRPSESYDTRPCSKLICIAQSWDAKTVQLRFKGRSEWRHP